MRGPHNIWRLVRTGATLERTGAMRAVLDAMEAPRALRVTLVTPYRCKFQKSWLDLGWRRGFRARNCTHDLLVRANRFS